MSSSINRSGSFRAATLTAGGAVLAALAVVALTAGPGKAASPSTAASSPSAPPPSTSPIATTAPVPASIELVTADDSDVVVRLVDRTGSITAAVSGRPGDGASVEGYSLSVANADASTLRLTWIDYPVDNELTLFVDEVDGRVRLLLVQPEPKGDTDAIGFDRELLLTFDHPVAARTVAAFLQDGLDTPG
jgi:hypothetical protein